MDVSVPFSDAEIDKLAEFLISDETPEECMYIATLDGFLTGLVIDPDTIPPSRWLPVVWGETGQDEIVWESKEKTERIVGLIMRLYNSITQAFQVDPPAFNPLLPVHEERGQTAALLPTLGAGA